ncbi:unnamed protein product [Brachionus calyciflorus]|uniref:Thioredoxin-like fold domain-containing protein n=1 Tax=Brachionus calyciflorus TaxID=104777 RepID=A0A814J1B9_9BILA|nr:unnamed protein product [Brachionus calyciflorus]
MNIKDFRLPWFDVEKSSQLTNKTTSLLDEILINMNRINSNDDGEIVETIESIKNMNNFIYILLEDIIKFYNVVEVPRLLILDLKTEELLNLKLTRFLSNNRNENQNRFVDESNYDYCLTNEVKFDRENLMKKCLKIETLDELKQSLINVNDAKNGLFKLNYYLLYFCSYHTVKNTQVFEKIITFLSNMQGKSKCSTSIILISSDSTEADYTNLINEFKSFTTKKYSIFKSYALNYGSKSLKEKLIKELRISAIPWFLLIDETNGDILCENMGAFILDNQMHSILF